MTRTLRYLFLLLFIGITGHALGQSGEIYGIVLDAQKQPAIGAIIKVDQGGINKGGAATDADGNYSIKPIQAGRYTLTVNYTGHAQVTVKEVVVSPDQSTKLNFNLEENKSNTTLNNVVITYVRPMVSPEKPGGNTHLDRTQINRMPTRSTSDFASQSIGAYQQKSGASVSLGGARAEGTLYIIDGVQVNGSSFIDQSPDVIDQMDVITSGIPAKYGDASGGVINITTRGVSRNFRGGINLEHSVDGYNKNLASFNLSGPFLSRKVNDVKKPIVGFFLAGDYRYTKDGNPSYNDNYVISDGLLNQLRANPLVAVPSTSGAPTLKYATEYVTAADLQTQKVRQNAATKQVNLTGKVDYEVTPGTNITAGGAFSYNNDQNYSRGLSLFAPDATPVYNSYTGRGYVRFTQRLGKSGAKQEENKITNAFYSVQADYQRDYASQEDPTFKRNPFDYGYVGKFTETLVPQYGVGTDTAGGNNTTGVSLLGYQQTGVKFERSEMNPYLANYTSQYLALGGQVPLTLTNVSSGYYLRNGDQPTATYGLWNNVGTTLSGYAYNRADQFSLSVDASFDYKMKKMKHAIEFGLYYQQRSERSYSYSNSSVVGGIWGLMRQLTSAVVNNNLDHNNPIFVVDGKQYSLADVQAGRVIPGPNDTILYNRRFSDSAETVGGFDYNLRKKLGAGKGDYLQPDSYDPSTFSLNMFTADELLNFGGGSLVSYYGYDYTGKILNGQVNFNDFWTQKDANGNYTRPIGAYRPNYIAGYITDNIRFKDINFNLGVRIERFDNNTKVLIDPYSLYATNTAGGKAADGTSIASHNLTNGGINPSNIGNGFVPYVDDNTSSSPAIIGYRDGDTWYDANGKEVADPQVLKAQSGRDPQPYLQNPQAPKAADAGFDPTKSFTDYTPQVNAMPRISFSFPINEAAFFYAHYDVIMQRPKPGIGGILSGAGAYASPTDYVNWSLGLLGTNAIGNPDLKPEQLINYEVGFQQALSTNSAVTLKTFYKERKDQIQIRPYVYAWPTTYYTYGNRDFSTNKGFGLQYELRRSKTSHIALTLTYTLQFTEGTGSNATSSGGGLLQYLVSAQLPNLRFPYALDNDSRHQITANLDYRYSEGEGPVIGGLHILQNAGANLLFTARSGEPYTKYVDATSLVTTTSKTIDGAINGSRLPWHYMVNLKVDKDLALNFHRTKEKDGQPTAKRKPYYLNVYAIVSNLLNTQDVLSVYSYTGNTKDDGYLKTPAGITTIASQTNAQSFTDLYNAALSNPGMLNNPRRITIGLNFNF